MELKQSNNRHEATKINNTSEMSVVLWLLTEDVKEKSRIFSRNLASYQDDNAVDRESTYLSKLRLVKAIDAHNWFLNSHANSSIDMDTKKQILESKQAIGDITEMYGI